ncbi:FAD-dependent oxidoreductase [Fictibacillus phosphorivorans]|uniref:FAD-dependent oxidoreductase n=1 Tax=Fictibacillus phosphorivorans TaxID=1221500 RepID=UPI00203C9DC6|nr:FAD-dependent oxidoreductase [Fictibacillus phosphorivorans]MCM3776947.1 FAD-dependent oxidoreductase [Fictibacillus phosphorivorans]
MNSFDKNLPQYPKSLWRENVDIPTYPALNENTQSDVVVVGGGIAGITTAYLLAKEGLQVILLEAGKVLNGTTGHTTAKITSQHNVIYDRLISHLGEERAKMYYKSNEAAGEFIRHFIKENGIHCNYETHDAFLYANTEQGINKLEKEASAYEQLGINGKLVDKMPFDIPHKKALVMKNQAHFHPVKYLIALLNEMDALGVKIYENTTATDIQEDKDDQKATVITENGHKVRGNFVACCTHFPFFDGMGFYFTRMMAERSYVLAVKTKDKFPQGMFLGVDDPARSYRSILQDGEHIVLIGGESHQTGQGIPTHQHYEALIKEANKSLNLERVLYRWSAQDLITLDKVPFIGKLTHKHDRIFVATGFRKWGMTTGTLAAHIIRDHIMGKENEFAEVYKPQRFQADPSDIKQFIKENADVAKHFVSGKLERPSKNPRSLKKDEGGAVTVDGKRCGAYRDPNGELFVVDTACTHLGCDVEWNSGERTWDCPCHGSRFTYQGDVVEGPATKPLKRVNP